MNWDYNIDIVEEVIENCLAGDLAGTTLQRLENSLGNSWEWRREGKSDSGNRGMPEEIQEYGINARGEEASPGKIRRNWMNNKFNYNK